MSTQRYSETEGAPARDWSGAIQTPPARGQSASRATQPVDVSPDATRRIQEFLNAAIAKSASDIHIEPRMESLHVRFRVDGMLIDYATLPLVEYDAILNAFKVLADLDIATRTIPQDGHIEIEAEQVGGDNTGSNAGMGNRRFFDIRISTFPSINGEVIVCRILNRANTLRTLDELGMDIDTLQRLRSMLLTSYGMILITGPTGHGKTTTLYSIMQELRKDGINITTLEDPVEFHLDWLRQSQINEPRGFTFERALSSMMRQDPDVLMIGEIRNPETAEYAVRTALVGRIVGSTIHAHSAIGTIARLVEMGVPRSTLGHALNGVVAQRLVRKLCDRCKEPYTPSLTHLAHFGLNERSGTFFGARGCNECDGSGYVGRTGIYSVLGFDDQIRHMIFDERPLEEIQQTAIAQGMKTLTMDAVSKILGGTTTVEEAARVV